MKIHSVITVYTFGQTIVFHYLHNFREILNLSTWGGSGKISVKDKYSQRPTGKILTIITILNLGIRGESECATSLVPSGILLSDECFLTHVGVTSCEKPRSPFNFQQQQQHGSEGGREEKEGCQSPGGGTEGGVEEEGA